MTWLRCCRFSTCNTLLNKVLKDKSRKEREDIKKVKAEAKRKLAGSDSEDDVDLYVEEATVKKAKFEESRAELRRKFKAHDAPSAFCQCFFPTEVS